jgi:hypothetical protein
MGNVANLKPKPFTSENQPSGASKSRKGIPNRATVFKKLLTLKAEKVLLDATEAEKGLTLVEAAALGQLMSARKGNTNAWKEIQDSIHGKLADKSEHTGKDGGPIEITTFQVEVLD